GRRPHWAAIRRGCRGLHDGPRGPAVPRPAAGSARREPGPGGAHARDHLQEPRRRLGALGGTERHLGRDGGADERSDTVGRLANRTRTAEHRARRQHRHRERPGLVAVATVVATVVAHRRIAAAALLTPWLLAVAGAGCRREPTVVAPPPPEV